MTTPDLRPGATFRHSRTCDRYRPVYYAAASGDFNPVHFDPEIARSASLPGPILQGMCTFAWLAEACTSWLGDPGRLTRLFTRFARPVAPGDTVTFDGRCVAVEGGVATLELTATNERGEEVLKRSRAEARVGPAGEAPRPGPGSGPTEPRAAGHDRRVGRRYGPYSYAVGVEKIRDFALAVAGGAPTRAFEWPADPPPHPWHVDEQAARASPYGGIVAPPTFAAVFAMQPFAAAILDPANGIDFLRLLHGEQEFRLFAPIRSGDLLETAGEITSVEQKPSLLVVTVASRTRNQRGELVLDGIWTAVIR